MLSKILRGLEIVEDNSGGLFIIVAVSLVFLQIVLRTVFDFGLSGLYEIASFCMIWSVFLTAGLGIKRNTHVRVDLLLQVVPPRVAFVLEVAIALLIVTVSLALFVSGWLLVHESVIFGDWTLGTVRIPMWLPQLIMPLGGFLMFVHGVGRIIGLLRGTLTERAGDETGLLIE